MSNYKVYCLTNILTKEKYIGVTKQKMYDRLKAGKGYKPTTKINLAIQKYGWNNFECKILFETSSKEIAGAKEREFIEKFNTIKNGYNNATGGFAGYTQTFSERARENMSKAQKGKHNSYKTEFQKGNYYQSSRNKKVPVLCIETGVEYESIKEAQQKLNLHHIWECANGKRNQCGGYHWKLIGGEE